MLVLRGARVTVREQGDAAGADTNTGRGFSVILVLSGSCRGWRATMQWGGALLNTCSQVYV